MKSEANQMKKVTMHNILYGFLQNGFSSIYTGHPLTLVLDTGNVYCAQVVSFHCKKNPDDSPAITGLPRCFQINLDWFPVDDLPEIFGCSSIARNAIRKYPFVLPHIIVFSSTVLISKVTPNLLIVGKLSLFSKGMHLQYDGWSLAKKAIMV